MKVCKHCNLEFIMEADKSFANHVRWCNKNPNSTDSKWSNGADSRLGIFSDFSVNCCKCNKEFTVNEREKLFPKKEKYFCSRSCANSRTFTDESNSLRSQSNSAASKVLWQNADYRKMMGEQMSNSKRFTSKNEVLIRTYFIENYVNDEWTFGGIISHNGYNLSRDLYSNKLKVCFEYDGVWHFKDIHGQLETKQIKDAALNDWCKQNDYRMIRLSESFAAKNKDFISILENFIYNESGNKNFGKEYIFPLHTHSRLIQ
jgi:very-short-patch-repair endonuclease